MFNYRRFYSPFQWSWRAVLYVWSWVAPVFYSVGRYARKALTWHPGSRGPRDEGPEGPEGPAERDCEAAAEGWETDPRRLSDFQKHDLLRSQEDVAVVEDEEKKEEEEEKEQEEEEEEEDDCEACCVEPTDEFYCCYDSTWETDESTSQPQRQKSKHYNFVRFENAARDMQNYRHNYPRKPPHWRNPSPAEMPNFNFYCGRQHSEPDGIYIHTFHSDWFERYHKLESVHTYIQWLFPLQEPGMNYRAPPLTRQEIRAFLGSDLAKRNLLKSYKLMLDFYGIRLENERTGAVKRAPNWAERFQNLNMNTHNNLRITRILKSLGTLGYPHYQAPLVRFFLEETLVHQTLPGVKDSALNYFLFAVLDKRQRRKLVRFAYSSYDQDQPFVWCPRNLQRGWSRSSSAKP